MEKSDVLVEIGRIVGEEWAANLRPVLLSNLPRVLERTLGADYKGVLAGRTLKAFLQENSETAEVQLVQDPAHHARVGAIPRDQKYVFPTSVPSSLPITAADARAFGRILDAMTPEEQRSTTLPASLVARLLAAR